MPQTHSRHASAQSHTPQKNAPPRSNEPHKAKPAAAPRQPDANEGEGSRTAARRYNDATEEYVQSGRSDEAAKAAEEALEGPEGEELRRAEEEGKAHASSLERESDLAGLDAEREAPKKRDKGT